MIRVWIVEDNTHFRSVVRELVDEHDQLSCQNSFASCEELFRKLAVQPAPDVLLLDVRLPGIDGIEAIRQIKEHAPNLEIIILTSFHDEEKIFRAVCAGASGYLLKSSSEEQIVQSILEVTRGGVPMTPSIARSVLGFLSHLTPSSNDYRLTRREQTILELMVEGLVKKEIAARLELSYHTVDSYLRNIYRKLRVSTRAEAVAKAIREGLWLAPNRPPDR